MWNSAWVKQWVSVFLLSTGRSYSGVSRECCCGTFLAFCQLNDNCFLSMSLEFHASLLLPHALDWSSELPVRSLQQPQGPLLLPYVCNHKLKTFLLLKTQGCHVRWLSIDSSLTLKRLQILRWYFKIVLSCLFSSVTHIGINTMNEQH